MSTEELDWSYWSDPYKNCPNSCKHDLTPCVLTGDLLSTGDGPHPTVSPFTVKTPIILGQSPWSSPKLGLKAAWASVWRRSIT